MYLLLPIMLHSLLPKTLHHSCHFCCTHNYQKLCILNYRLQQFGYNRFHDRILWILPDIGGYTENDIKIYGKNRFKLGGDFMKMFNKDEDEMSDWSFDRYQVALNFNLIHKPHPYVNPFRTDLTGTVYFHNNLGLFVSGIYGHDNYNYRFVDSGFQLFTGLVFDPFPRIQWKR